MASADVIVIGGGIQGCSTAFNLAKRGVSVQLFEKDTAGRHASGVNAGGVRQIGRALPEIPLSVASMDLWYRIEDILDDDCGFAASGHINVAENESDLEILRQRGEMVRAAGYEHEELIGQNALRELLPAVSDHCVGGLISRRDGAALPYRTVQAFRRKALSLGARIEESSAVKTLKRQNGVWRVTLGTGEVHEAPTVINTAGAWANELARQTGEAVPMHVIAPMLMISERVQPFLAPVVSATVRPLSFKQFPNGTVLIGGGYEGRAVPEKSISELDFIKLAQNAQTVFDLFPIMRDVSIVRAWAGIEGRMEDGIPVIGPSSTEEGLFHAFGFSAHGFQLGPIVGSIIADLATTGATAHPIVPFSISRFQVGSEASKFASVI